MGGSASAADILHRQRQPCLVAGDGLMLCAVITECPCHLLHVGDEPHIPHYQAQFNKPFDNGFEPVGRAYLSQKSEKEQGKISVRKGRLS